LDRSSGFDNHTWISKCKRLHRAAEPVVCACASQLNVNSRDTGFELQRHSANRGVMSVELNAISIQVSDGGSSPKSGLDSDSELDRLDFARGVSSVGDGAVQNARAQVAQRKSKHRSLKIAKKKDLSIVGGVRKKKSALHGSGASKWYYAKNWYYKMLDISWKYVFLLVTMAYILTCIFASLFTMIFAHQIECESGVGEFIPGSFGAACVFSVSNVLTLGFGPCLPGSYGLYILACLQQYVGILLSVIVLSMVVSKFQIPKPDIKFSKNGLITTRNGEPVLLIRVGNLRVNLLFETRVQLSVLRPAITDEGESYVEYKQLKVDFPAGMSAVATCVHRIDSSSELGKLLRLCPNNLDTVALSVSFSGQDAVYNDTLLCTTQYKGSDLIVGAILFDDMFEKQNNDIKANFDRFDDIKASNATDEEVFEAVGIFPEDADNSPVGGMMSPQSPARVLGDLQTNTQAPETLESGIVYLFYGNVPSSRNQLVRYCPCSRLVYMFLVKCNIRFEVVDIDWTNIPEWYIDMNPSGRTPCVSFNGSTLTSVREILMTLSAAFPEEANSLNRSHHLPMSVLDVNTLLETLGYSIILAPIEKMEQMKRMNFEEATFQKLTDRVFSRLVPGNSKTQYEKGRFLEFVRSVSGVHKPAMRDGNIYICVGAKYRGGRLVRACPYSQSIELLMHVHGVQFSSVLVDLDDLPAWLGIAVELPILFNGSQVAATGAPMCVECLASKFPDKFHGVQKRFQELDLIVHKLYTSTATCVLKCAKQEKGNAHITAVIGTLTVIQSKLAEQESCLHWQPFLCEESSFGLDDAILAPHLYRCVRVNLVRLAKFDLCKNGFSRLDRYIRGIANTHVFRNTIDFYYVASLWILDEVTHLEQLVGIDQLPEEFRDIENLQAQGKKACDEHFASHGIDRWFIDEEGELNQPGGVFPPPMEMNVFYLAIGCFKRGNKLVKVCPYSRVIEMVAREMNIPIVFVKIDTGKKPEWFTDYVHGTSCPTMYWNGDWIKESQVVLDNLKVLFPEEIKPFDIPLRLNGALENKHGMGLLNTCDRIVTAYMLCSKRDPTRESKYNEVLSLLQSLEDALSSFRTPRFFSGSSIVSIDDIAIVGSIWRFVHVSCRWFFKLDMTSLGFPLVSEWVERFEQRESFVLSLPPLVEPFLLIGTSRYYLSCVPESERENHSLAMTPLLETMEKKAIRNVELSRNRGDYSEACDFTLLTKFELVLRFIENALTTQGSYLCDSVIGYADILLFSTLFQLGCALHTTHGYDYSKRGFTNIDKYLRKVRSMPEFASVMSPECDELFRVCWMRHFMDVDEPVTEISSSSVSGENVPSASRRRSTKTQQVSFAKQDDVLFCI